LECREYHFRTRLIAILLEVVNGPGEYLYVLFDQSISKIRMVIEGNTYLITCLLPFQVISNPLPRLEKVPQGWFFTGPYNGQTRRLYHDGKKDIRFVLEGEEDEPLR
jgi:hypothetical protein